MARKNLFAQLSVKATELRKTQAEESAASAAFIAASTAAIAASDLAGTHAKAVEEAVSILEAAGVAL